MGILIFIITMIPILLISFFIYHSDYIEKESTLLLLILFVGGICATFLTSGINDLFIKLIPTATSEGLKADLYTQFLNSFVRIGFLEEFSKWLVLILLIWKNKEFNYLYDSIVYCVFIGLGFAFIESFQYVSLFDMNAVIVRTLFTTPMHALLGVFMGYFFAYGKLGKNTYKLYLSLIVPMILHGVYDFILSIAANSISYVIYFSFIAIVYILAFKLIKSLNQSTLRFYNE